MKPRSTTLEEPEISVSVPMISPPVQDSGGGERQAPGAEVRNDARSGRLHIGGKEVHRPSPR